MPLEGLTTYLPTMAQILAHWLDVNLELGGAAPTDLKLQGGFTRTQFQASYDALEAALQGQAQAQAHVTAAGAQEAQVQAVADAVAQAGAASVDELETMLRAAGFVDLRITPMDASRAFIHDWLPGKNPGDYVLSASIEAVKPGGGK